MNLFTRPTMRWSIVPLPVLPRKTGSYCNKQKGVIRKRIEVCVITRTRFFTCYTLEGFMPLLIWYRYNIFVYLNKQSEWICCKRSDKARTFVATGQQKCEEEPLHLMWSVLIW
jgi:hypothetical protein